jgi:hemoglobin
MSMIQPRRAGSLVVFPTLVLLGMAGPIHAQESAGEESLYDRLGGLRAISLVVSDFMTEFAADPLVLANPAVRERKSPENLPYINHQVTTLVCQVTGGPCVYTGMELGPAHAGLNVSQAEWDRMAEIFAGTLAKYGVPEREQEELFEILGASHGEIVVPAGR